MSPWRYFAAVPLQSPFMLGGVLLVVLLGTVQLVLAPDSGREAVATLLLLQMFSASSGFVIPARRGHYDPILTGGASRTAVIAAHAVMSIGPGVIGWLGLGAFELMSGHAAVFSAGSVAALVLVSAAGWAVTVPLPRLSGGVIWLVLLLAGLGWSAAWRQDVLAVAAGGASLRTRALVYVLCPFVLGGRSVTEQDALALLPALGLAAVGCLAAWRWLVRVDLPLEAAQ